MSLDYETAHFAMCSEGYVYTFVPLGEEERDIELLGHIDGCSQSIPDDLLDEYEELESVYREWQREANGYHAGVDLAWRTAKGC